MVCGKVRLSVLVFHTAVILLIYSCRGESQVIGPLHPIVALIGEDIILPCYLNPVMNAFPMTVEWARPDLNPRFVLVWRDGLELESKKNVLYSSRTSLFTDELKHGNISLKLSSVKLSDEGTYRCFLPELDRDSTIQLVVGAASSLVNISEISRNSSAVELQCESAGWYPEPEVLWLDDEGNLLSAGSTETFRGPDGLCTVSSRVTVEKRHSNKLTCRVQQNNINQSRETWIHGPDDFVTDPPPPSPSSSSVVVIIGVIVGIMFIVAVVFFVWKRRQIKLKKKKHHHGDEETVKIVEKTNSSGGNDPLSESLIEREAAKNVNMERNLSSERTGSDIQTEDETHQSQTNNHLIQTQEETENQPGHEGAERQPLVERGRQTDQPLDTMNGSDKDQDTASSENSPMERVVNNEGNETETVRENTNSVMDEETQQEQLIEERNADMETNSSNERTGSNIRREDETHQSQTNNHLTQTQEETEKQSEAVRENTNSDMDKETQQHQLIVERNTVNNLQAEGEKNLQEVQSDLDKEMKKLKSKLQAKERDERECEKEVTRLTENKTTQEKLIKNLKEQLEHVERKLQFKNEKEETQREEDEKDLQRKKEEFQKQLKRLETALETSNKKVDVMSQRKLKATKEKEEIIRKLEMKNRNENQSESDEDL